MRFCEANVRPLSEPDMPRVARDGPRSHAAAVAKVLVKAADGVPVVHGVNANVGVGQLRFDQAVVVGRDDIRDFICPEGMTQDSRQRSWLIGR